MDRRSSKLVMLGAAVFVIGAGLLFVGLRSNTGQTTATTPPSASPQPSEPGTRVVVQDQGTTEVPVVSIPGGHEAVTLQLPVVRGVGGYARAGDRINIYAAVKSGEGTSGLEPPFAKLVLRNVDVLDVRGTDGADPTFLLALRTAEVERLVFFASFESLWASLAPDDTPARRSTGIDHSTSL